MHHFDPEKLRAAGAGDRTAQYQLYKWCYPILMAVCVRYQQQHDDAADLLNQGFLKVIQNIGKYNPDAPFEAWIRRIMINTAIDQYRRQKVERRDTVQIGDWQEVQHEMEHTSNTAAGMLDLEHLQAMINRLTPMAKKVFNLFAIDGFSHQEISDLLGISVGTSKWHLSDARARLQEWVRQFEKQNN
jgi:RNA polymerase sigma factor (sigma-70 family)